MGAIQGKGEFLWPDGRRYNGSYVQSLKHGYGEYYFDDGSSYRGYWIQGLQHGDGKIITISGKVRCSGEWKQGVLKSSNTKPKDETLQFGTNLDKKPLSDPEVPQEEFVSNLKHELNSPGMSSEIPLVVDRDNASSCLSLCEAYLDMSLEILPSAVRNEIIVPESQFGCVKEQIHTATN